MLPDPAAFTIFLLAAVALLVTPGPAVLYIVARSVDQGWRAGVVSTLGIAVGTAVHVAGAALGLSAILLSSVIAFSVIKYLGAAYLVYLGIRTLARRDEMVRVDAPPPEPLRRIFVQGIVVNLLNPKSALFIFAFIPQFVDPARGAIGLQVATLGLVFAVLGVASDSVWAVAAGSASAWLRRQRAFQRVQRTVAGLVYVALGITAAFAGDGGQK